MPADKKDPEPEAEGDETATWVGGFEVPDSWEEPEDGGMRQRRTIDLERDETKPLDPPADDGGDDRWKK